jgi:hypothetical protein
VSQENTDNEEADRRKGLDRPVLTARRPHAHAQRLRNLTGENRGSCV